MTYRLPTTILSLPNDSNSIRVPLNTTASNTEFNKVISKLDENFHYLLESATVVDNRSPIANDYFYDFGDGDRKGINDSETPTAHNYKFINVVDKINGDILFIASKIDSIDFWVYNESGNTLTLETSYTTINSVSSQLYINITSVTLYNNRIYVYDSNYGVMVVYDINSFVNGDELIDDIKYIKHFSKLDGIIEVAITTSSVYAVTPSELIHYNRDFNIVSTTTLNESNPNDILVVGDLVYILTDHTISIYNKSLVYIESFTLANFAEEEYFKFIESEVDAGVVYLLTAEHVVKVDLSGKSEIGYFKLSAPHSDPYLSIAVKAIGDQDDVYILDEYRLHNAVDALQFVDIYDTVNMEDIVNIDDLQINNLELEQDFVFNSVLQKLSFNTILLYNSIIFNGVVTTEENGFIEYSHLLNQANSNTFATVSLYAGQNEVFSYQLFSKSFERILEIQLAIKELLEFELTDSDTNTLII